jgi:hypothetical protein
LFWLDIKSVTGEGAEKVQADGKFTVHLAEMG